MSDTSNQALPPMTNRGVVRPDNRQCGAVDYLKLTVWATPTEVCKILERGVLDKYGWGEDDLSNQEDWIEKPAGGRTAQVFDAGSLAVVEYTDEVFRNDEFCSVEVKGRGCERLGNEGVQFLMLDLAERFRTRASRVDVMAHTELFTPSLVHDSIHNDNYNSRSVNPKSTVFITSDAGDTCYLGMGSKPNGGLRRIGERVTRVYNRRGTTRVEMECHQGYAAGAEGFLRFTPLEQWPMLIRSMLRHHCDFIDCQSDPRKSRCKLLPWWESFVGDVEKLSVRAPDNHFESTPIGKVDGTLERYARWLYAAQEAFGRDWISQRIEHHGRLKWDQEHVNRVAELERFRGRNIAGVPGYDDEVPF
jgi:hypothetical protein